jgi:formamidopyrimidine-DNA glycosylase
MPELPEVECLTRAVRRVLKGGRIEAVTFLRDSLRDPIPTVEFKRLLLGAAVEEVFRRSKYMLVQTQRGFGVFHLGMTGNMLLMESAEPKIPHTHAVFTVKDKGGKSRWLHFVDPRRFGRIDCLAGATYDEHPWFAELGPEPLSRFDLGQHLFTESRRRKQPVKCFLMDAKNVVGVGNIYASESLFRAGISPRRAAGTVTRERYALLADCVRDVLKESIAAGGTTFRDYKGADGDPGYYAVRLHVYDRDGEPCKKCGTKIRLTRQAGRSTYFCPACQR